MMIFNGKAEAEKILSDLKKKIKKIKAKPALAVISVGRDTTSELFIRNKKRAAKEINIKTVFFRYVPKVKEKEIIKRIKNLNKNPKIKGIIVQLPLPEKFKTDKIIDTIAHEKDIDGFRKRTLFSSPLISAILIALRKSNKKIKNKKILALVNSDIFGKALKKTLKKEGFKTDYTKNKKNSKINKADIIITVLGKPGLIKKEMIKKGAILIDAGITVTGKNKIVGDVDRESIKDRAEFLTPVPGGIGPLNVALLLKNVYLAAKKYGNS